MLGRVQSSSGFDERKHSLVTRCWVPERGVGFDSDSFIDEDRGVYTVEHYVTRGGKDVFLSWYERMRDRRGQLAVGRRVNRIAEGNFGDHKPCVDGVWELRIDFGPGFRVYYAMDGERIVLLLCGGDKSTQQGDIRRASAYWEDWKERSDEK